MDEKTPAEVLAAVEEHDVEIVDFRFCDLPGVMQHVSIPAGRLTEERACERPRSSRTEHERDPGATLPPRKWPPARSRVTVVTSLSTGRSVVALRAPGRLAMFYHSVWSEGKGRHG